MELQHNTRALRTIEALSKTTARVEARLEMRDGIRKVLQTSAKIYLAEHEREDSDVRINGRVVTRVVFIDENGGYNSEERTNNFSEKVILSNSAAISDVLPNAHVIETKVVDTTAQSVDTVTSFEITLLGLAQREVKFIQGATGEVEQLREKTRVATFGQIVSQRFEVEERVDLDKSCEGILSVDIVPALREIVVGEGKMTAKGTAAINVLATKRAEEAIIYNDTIDFDFSKTIQAKFLKIDDTVFGAVTVANLEIKSEQSQDRGPQLVITAEFIFRGFSVESAEVESLSDIFSFTNNLELRHSDVDSVVVLPSTHTNIEVDSNLQMGEKSPFITRILSTSQSVVNSLTIVPANDKVTLEGQLSCAVVFECEEKQIHSHTAIVPFSTSVKLDGVSASHSVQAYATVQNCKVRARRGRELLVDARLAVSLSATTQTTVRLVTDVAVGETKPADDSAILIYTVGEGETLWDVAKRLGVRASEILAQNNIQGEVSTGERIFIYRQQVVNF